MEPNHLLKVRVVWVLGQLFDEILIVESIEIDIQSSKNFVINLILYLFLKFNEWCFWGNLNYSELGFNQLISLLQQLCVDFVNAFHFESLNWFDFQKLWTGWEFLFSHVDLKERLALSDIPRMPLIVIRNSFLIFFSDDVFLQIIYQVFIDIHSVECLFKVLL